MARVQAINSYDDKLLSSMYIRILFYLWKVGDGALSDVHARLHVIGGKALLLFNQHQTSGGKKRTTQTNAINIYQSTSGMFCQHYKESINKDDQYFTCTNNHATITVIPGRIRRRDPNRGGGGRL